MRQDYQTDLKYAVNLDKQCPLSAHREAFLEPRLTNLSGYFCGQSLGLQLKAAHEEVQNLLKHWADFGTAGYFQGHKRFFDYHEQMLPKLARLVGAQEHEVTIMNSLTTNLHLMMASFYKPQAKRHKILIEAMAFPSDRYALRSQIALHGFDPDQALIEMYPQSGEHCLSLEAILDTINQHKDELALIVLPGVQYYTGQLFDMAALCHYAQQFNIPIGLDLAHAVGNIPLSLHEWGPDFAVWCHYKYVNAGPGAPAGVFVHHRHAQNKSLRMAGWWGQEKSSRMDMPKAFTPIAGAQGWQLSCPPILSAAPLSVSLDLFDKVGIDVLNAKSKKLTGYLRYLLSQSLPEIDVITPQDQSEHGAQLSLHMRVDGQALVDKLAQSGFYVDFRLPDVIRVAPMPFYNQYEEVYHFVHTLTDMIRGEDAIQQSHT